MDKDEMDRLEKEDATRQVIARNAAWQVVQRIAANGVPLAVAIETAMGLPGSVIAMKAAAEMLFLNEAKEGLAREGRSLEMKKAGYDLPLEIAAKGAGKGPALRKIWRELLKNALDDDFDHSIRITDLDLLSTFDPPDAILLLLKGKYQTAMNEAWRQLKDARIDASLPEDLKQLFSRACNDTIFLEYANLELENSLNISFDEYLYSLKSRNIDFPGVKSPLFTNVVMADNSGNVHDGRLNILLAQRREIARNIVAYGITEPAARLYRLISKP